MQAEGGEADGGGGAGVADAGALVPAYSGDEAEFFGLGELEEGGVGLCVGGVPVGGWGVLAVCGRSVGSTHPGHGQRGQRPPRWPRQRGSWKSCSVWCSTGAEKVGAGRDGEDPQGHDLVWGLYGLCRHLLYPFYTTLSRGGDICQAKTAELRTLPVPIWADGPLSAILVRGSSIGSLGSPGPSNGRENAPVPLRNTERQRNDRNTGPHLYGAGNLGQARHRPLAWGRSDEDLPWAPGPLWVLAGDWPGRGLG